MYSPCACHLSVVLCGLEVHKAVISRVSGKCEKAEVKSGEICAGNEDWPAHQRARGCSLSTLAYRKELHHLLYTGSLSATINYCIVCEHFCFSINPWATISLKRSKTFSVKNNKNINTISEYVTCMKFLVFI
jgi:hypothetical protein